MRAGNIADKIAYHNSMPADFTLVLPAAYRPDFVLSSLGRDAQNLTERVDGAAITRAIPLTGGAALLHIEIGPRAAACRIEAAFAPTPADTDTARAIAERLLALLPSCDPAAFEATVDANPALAPLIGGRRGLRVPLTGDLWEAITWAIVGQQINLPFAYALRRRLTLLCGTPVRDGGDFYTHPTPREVAALAYDDLAPHQFSRRKAEYLIDTARLIDNGTLTLDAFAVYAPADIEARLVAVRGIGPWSAHYVMMRGYGLPDCVPLGDTGLTLTLQRFFGLATRPGPAETLRLMEPFAPHRSLATYHLWRTLEPVVPVIAPILSQRL